MFIVMLYNQHQILVTLKQNIDFHRENSYFYQVLEIEKITAVDIPQKSGKQQKPKEAIIV